MNSEVAHQPEGYLHLTAAEPLEVVIVDDDPIFRELMCALIKSKANFSMLEASSTKELMNYMDTKRIDCILLDYNLGNESGLAALNNLSERYKGVVPVIMLSGDTRQRTAISAFQMGAQDYVQKIGVKPEYIVARILRAVERCRNKSVV